MACIPDGTQQLPVGRTDAIPPAYAAMQGPPQKVGAIGGQARRDPCKRFEQASYVPVRTGFSLVLP